MKIKSTRYGDGKIPDKEGVHIETSERGETVGERKDVEASE
jgi:hypothetical protein